MRGLGTGHSDAVVRSRELATPGKPTVGSFHGASPSTSPPPIRAMICSLAHGLRCCVALRSVGGCRAVRAHVGAREIACQSNRMARGRALVLAGGGVLQGPAAVMLVLRRAAMRAVRNATNRATNPGLRPLPTSVALPICTRSNGSGGDACGGLRQARYATLRDVGEL